mmetsp:Transcript_1671/g.2933  ORF Transcript_1671/g.2933 Transcript_1671/m.2933 type:complete len:276 (+) Transcript_1671:72-899(+)
MQADKEHHFDEFAGEKEHQFQGSGCNLIIRTYEDFMQNAIGGVVTRASKDLARWATEVPKDWHGCQTVELGSGCGLVSSALLRMGAHIIATDLPEILPHLEYNISLNACSGCDEWHVQALNWDSSSDRAALRSKLGSSGADAIFAANCVYTLDTVEMFLETLKALSGPDTLALMCGVPVPPAMLQDGETSIIDAFLSACPRFFDSYLLEVPGSLEDSGEELREQKDSALALQLASPHGLRASALADGIWLFKLPGCPCPSWVRPLLVLESMRETS